MSTVLKSIASIAEVQQLVLQKAANSPQGLVLFDVDWTLSMPRHPASHYLLIPVYRAYLPKILSSLRDTANQSVPIGLAFYTTPGFNNVYRTCKMLNKSLYHDHS